MHIVGKALTTGVSSLNGNTTLASNCFPICFRAGLEAQYAGKDYPQLCLPDTGFQNAYSGCSQCLSQWMGSSSTPSGFAQFFDFCSNVPPASLSSPIAPTAETTTTAPPVETTPTTTSGPASPSMSTSIAFSTPSLTTPSTIVPTTTPAPVSTITKSVLTTFTATVTKAGSIATFTVPDATVYKWSSTITKTIRFFTSPIVCPSLVHNTDYTATAPLPTDYTWGCRPGSLCQSHQYGCNYELFPAEDYYCSPEDCIAVSALPAATPTTIPFPFVKNYLYLDPADFGLAISQVFDLVAVETSTIPVNSTFIASLPTSSSRSTHRVSPGVIAGSTISGVAGLTLLLALLGFLLLRQRRRRKQAALAETAGEQEKAQLHSDDIKPIWTELDAGIKRKPVPPREMAANEEPVHAVSEMPANEVVGSEMESSSGMEKGASSTATAVTT